LIKEIILGFITAPFKLVRNIVSKHMARKR
jgi:hypothetical protein